jgi:hypothetical protein
MATLVMLSEAVPVLVSVTFCAGLATCRCWLLKERLVGERLTIGLGVTPVPVSVAGVGGVPELNVTLTVAVEVPVTTGANVTLILQDPPAATLVQLLVCEKTPGFVP